MVLRGGDGGVLWWCEAEDDDDLEILDDNDQSCVNATVNKDSPCTIHDCQRKGKRKVVAKPKVPAKKLCLANKKLSSCSVKIKSDFVEKSSSTLTHYNEVKSLFLTANISTTEYEVLIPSKDQRANKPPEGYMAVYKEQIKEGLRFPLHGLLVEVCNVMNVSPSQLTPSAHSLIVGFLLCMKFYKIPATTELFFSLFKAHSAPTGGFFYFTSRQKFRFLENNIPMPNAASWKKKFFFLKPTRISWNCITKWNETHAVPTSDDSLAESAVNLGLMEYSFQLRKLIQKNFLVHGGIQPGNPASELTFRSLMTRVAITEHKLLPQAESTAHATTQGRKILSREFRSEPVPSSTSSPATIPDTLKATGPASNLVSSTGHAASPVSLSASQAVNHQQSHTNPSPTGVSILKDSSASSKDTIPLNEVFPKEKENQTAKCFEPHVNMNSSMSAADDCARLHALLPPHLLAVSQILESMYVQKECYQKLQMDMKELTSELTYTKSRVEELEQELELSEAKRVDSENRTYLAMEDVKRLEKTVKDLKSDSSRHHDKIMNDANDAFKSSQEFLDSIEKIRKDAVDTFKSSHEFSIKKIREDTIDAFKSSQEFLDSLDQIRRDAIEKFKLSEEFLDWNDKIRKHVIKTFKYSDEFLESCERIRKDAIQRYKSSDEFLESLDHIRKVAVESFKSSSEFLDFRDNTWKEAIEVFRCSDDFREEIDKYYVNGFETCRIQLMNCGKLPNGFNFDFLDVGAVPWGKPPVQDYDGTVADLCMKSIKPES